MFASLWEGDGLRLWTLVNRAEAAYSGNLLAVPHDGDTRYFDLIKGEEANVKLKEASPILTGR